MIDPNTPLEEIAEMCNSMEDLCNLLKQCEYKKNIEDDIQISPKLLQEAILKTKHLKTVTISDIQKLLRVGYSKAAKLYELITNSKINEKWSLQTKERLKELETQISQLDFDIEQEKQRTFAELTPAKVIQFPNKAICGDVQDIGVRKALVKYLIRDIILYNDKIIINYYFSDPLKKYNNSIESVKETEKQSKEAAPLSDFLSSYKGDNSPPNWWKGRT